MKTKYLQFLLIITTLSALLFTACSKNNNNNNNGTSTTDLQTQSDDQARVSTETDATFDDVNVAMSSSGSVAGTGVSPILHYGIAVEGGNSDTVKTTICDATVVVDSVDNPRTITINYNGSNCNLTRKREGKVVISIASGVRWSQAGAQVTVNFVNLKVTRLLDGKAITFNGTHTYTNVSGGLLISLNANSTSPITHTLTSSNMSITFDDGTQRTWSIAKQRVFSYSSGIVVTETGMHSNGNLNGIAEWGTNRFGNSFTSQIAQAIVVSQSCNWQVTSGQYVLINAGGTLTLTFGLNSTGQATGCPVSSASYYFQLVWAGSGGKTYTFIAPY